MPSNISRTRLSETTLRKSSPGSLGVPKLSRMMTSSEPTSPSPTQHSRFSLDLSSANRSRKVPTPPEVSLSMRTHTRAVIGGSSESQPRLIQVKEDLRKANELIASLEDEKAKALDELKQVQEKAYEQMYEAFQVEENFEIEKFKAVEAGVEAFHRQEEELKKELEIVKNQHASDSALLLLVTRELEKVTQQLAAANDAKNMLSSHAEKVDILSSDLIRLNALLDSTREKETIASKQIAVLKNELENARCFEAEVKKGEMIIEKLNGEIEVLNMAKSYAHGSADQWCNKAMELEEQLEEANMMKRSAVKQLEGSKEEAGKLKSELETVNEEKKQGLKREQDANSSVQILLEEKHRLLSELEKSVVAKQSLASALLQASNESRVLKEKLLSLGGQDYETQAEHYKKMLEEARHEINVLVSAAEKAKKQFESSMVDWEMREAGLVNHVKKFDEEVSSMGKEMNRLGTLVKRTKEEADGARKKESQMRDDLKEVEDEVICLQETLREARAESLKLNAKMLDKETEFQSVIHENDLLRVKEDDSMKKIKELSKLLEEALAKKHTEEDEGELSEREKDYDLLPKVVEFSEENSSDDDTVEVEYSMWESYHTGKKEAFHKGK
ncbi:hypothetical protein N665_0299s0054 [Sinapis alba]|nr:hypothetical protein N665_0299s0054 [Sinapis alba]